MLTKAIKQLWHFEELREWIGIIPIWRTTIQPEVEDQEISLIQQTAASAASSTGPEPSAMPIPSFSSQAAESSTPSASEAGGERSQSSVTVNIQVNPVAASQREVQRPEESPTQSRPTAKQLDYIAILVRRQRSLSEAELRSFLERVQTKALASAVLDQLIAGTSISELCSTILSEQP